jgi:hypothetical protein
MQTFLSSYDLRKNAEVLDNKRLFKQLLEGYQILKTLTTNTGWIHHPAVIQWKNHEPALLKYIESIWIECQARGIALDSQLYFNSKKLIEDMSMSPTQNPAWWGREDIISSHRGRLLCKGEIDVICQGIKKSQCVRSIDTWLKSKFKKSKNQLKYADIKTLKSWLSSQEILSLPKNHYLQFGWKEMGSEEYVWPV